MRSIVFRSALVLLAGPAAAGDDAPVPAPEKIEIYPSAIRLTGARDRQSVIVQATRADGTTQDVTAGSKLSLEGGAARIEGNVLLPAADGASKLVAEFAGKTASATVETKDAKGEAPIGFRLDVMPVFMRGGCNFGACHGSSRGKDGFRLSLFGFDPAGDYGRITREVSARRINPALPAESLLLRKATGAVPHTGGKRFGEESDLYRTLHSWIAAGAPADAGEVPRVTAVEVLPPLAVLDGKGAVQALTVRAAYSDGTDRDVTGLAWFLSANDSVASVGQDGRIVAGDRGEAIVTARFDTHTVRTHVIALPAGLRFEFPAEPEDHPIDRLVNGKLRKLRIAPSGPASDEAFLRRATLDVNGRLPTPAERERFLSRTEPDKRAILVDELLGRKEFVELWVMKWSELLQIRSSDAVSPKAMLLYHGWLESMIAGNVPMDRMVGELIAATGGTFGSPPTNYYQAETDVLKVAENVAQVFMGMRIQCAQCHNHPFDRWTQDDYYGFAAFFSQIGRKAGEDPRETIVFNRGEGEVTHPVGGRKLKPRFLGAEEPDTAGKDRRAVLAAWLASPRNPWFASNLANIVWAHFMGRGIIELVDDVRATNPPVNEELLSELARRFVEYKYDFRRLVRDICTSRTYGRSTEPNETNLSDSTNFSRAAIRRIRAEVLSDIISQVTETRDKFPGLPLGARAVQIADGSASTYFLSAFGRAERKTVCSCEVRTEPNLSQALHLLNGDTVARKIAEGRLIERLLGEGKKPVEVAREIFLRCLSREPTEEESKAIEAGLAGDSEPKKALEDLFWAVLNSREFVFNH